MNTPLSPSEGSGLVPPPGLPPQGCEPGELIRALFKAGIVHELGGCGPRKFDCYGMMQLAQLWLFGRETAAVRLAKEAGRKAVLDAISTHEARRLWRPVKDRPRHGDIVSMTHVREPFHIGTWLDVDRGVILHCASFTGLAVDDRSALIGCGWNNLRFYRFAGDA
ncbi:MAG: hypothetical protein KF765_12185 [Parvibaculaceae bacterium]|nr:hypothetical protein [Parvibaculaceae bacterium]